MCQLGWACCGCTTPVECVDMAILIMYVTAWMSANRKVSNCSQIDCIEMAMVIQKCHDTPSDREEIMEHSTAQQVSIRVVTILTVATIVTDSSLTRL